MKLTINSILAMICWGLMDTSFAASQADRSAHQPRQRVVISDDYTSWLLKGPDTARYGDGEALPRLLDEGWIIASVTTGCQTKGHTVYVLNAPIGKSGAQK